MAVQTEREPQTVGELIRFWRTQRRLTQMELALDANLSTKHLSFVETGRSRPSRQLLVHLAQHLDLPAMGRPRKRAGADRRHHGESDTGPGPAPAAGSLRAGEQHACEGEEQPAGAEDNGDVQPRRDDAARPPQCDR